MSWEPVSDRYEPDSPEACVEWLLAQSGDSATSIRCELRRDGRSYACEAKLASGGVWEGMVFPAVIDGVVPDE